MAWRGALITCGTVVAATLLAAQTIAPLQPLTADGRVPYFIALGEARSEFHAGDLELARWALQAWEKALGGVLKFELSSEDDALVRVHWVAPGAGQYGEMRPLDVGGRRGAAVYIRPDTKALGPDISERARLDALFRDTVVYLTCVHELGHALGLEHTAEFADIMYFFGFGGDIGEFFDRYRRRLKARDDIRAASALSAGDLAQLAALYHRGPRPGQLTAVN